MIPSLAQASDQSLPSTFWILPVPVYVGMSSKQAVICADAPPANDLMSQAVICNNMVFCSGSLGINPMTGKFAEGSVVDRTVS